MDTGLTNIAVCFPQNIPDVTDRILAPSVVLLNFVRITITRAQLTKLVSLQGFLYN